MNTHDKVNTGFSLVFTTGSGKTGGWGRIICALLLFIGLGGCLWSILGFAGLEAAPLLVLLIGCVFCVLSCKLPGIWDFTYIGVAVVLAVLVFAAHRFVIEGGGMVMNQIYGAMESYIGRSFPRFYVDEEINAALCANIFLVITAGLLAILCGRIAEAGGGWRYVLLPLVICIWIMALIFRAVLPIICALFLTIGTIALPASRSTELRSVAANSRITVWVLFLSAILTGISAIPALFIIDSDGSKADSMRLAASRKIHSLRYDGEYQGLPGGDFHTLMNFVLDEDPALTISMDDSGQYYLRGFVGEVYTGDGWTTLTPKRRAQYAPLFTWLHERDFYAQNQYAMVLEALGAEGESKTVYVNNDGVSTAYLYSPYEVENNPKDEGRIGDENLRAFGLRGEASYELRVREGSVSDYERFYASLVAGVERNDPKVIGYLTSESAYREFIYANYLELPAIPRAAIEKLFAEVELPEGKVDFFDAKIVANAYLGTFGYTEKMEPGHMNNDVLTYFLEEKGVGNSVHFATAAVLMFRYMGIPARYVEGYLISPGSETNEAGEIILRSKDMYAWAEIYRDGVGFVPFEPEFPAIPPLSIIGSVAPEDEVEEPPAVPPIFEPKLWFAMLLGIVVVLLIIFAVLYIRRMTKYRALQKLFEIRDNGEAVSRMTTYAVFLLSHMGINRENGSLYKLCGQVESKLGSELGMKYWEVISLQQAALFSGQKTDPSARMQLRGFLEDIKGQIKEQCGPAECFRLKWLECIL